MRRVVIMGAGGRDFHDFNTVFREDASVHVVAFTAAQIPGIENRLYPPSLAGPLYPQGIPIRAESELGEIVRTEGVDTVVLAYSDLRHEDVMHKASRVLAAGPDFTLLGPRATMLEASRPVIAVTAVRTGCGKSPASRRIGMLLRAAGLRVGLVRHPMPYGDLAAQRVQRFASVEDIDAAGATLEEREEYELPVSLGMTVYAGVDYAAVLELAQGESDVLLWDGGNNDLPFFRPDLHVVVTDPLRPDDVQTYHPGETNLLLADVVVVNKIDSGDAADVERVLEQVRTANPYATVVLARSPVTLDAGPALAGARVLVVEDGPTLTHGGMSFGAGTVAALKERVAEMVDPRPFAVGSIAEVFERYPHVGRVLPAMGYSDEMLSDLAATIEAADVDVVVAGTPIDLARLVETRHPIRRARYELEEIGRPTLADALASTVRLVRAQAGDAPAAIR
ncbi:MAG TPA: cyclic 2,3-diphosphoglycerate synthase [Gaiellaceae bacterium]|nr:cyclic 2,3-diphosphoglycerate synthase [Gaiellaceae bacterium]